LQCAQLETDADILAQKAKSALANYGVSLVVANMLQTYQERLIIFTKAGEQIPISRDADPDIETKLVHICIEQHSKHIEQQQ
jgi:hypothetical protein